MKTRTTFVLSIVALITLIAIAGYYFLYAYIGGLSQQTADLNEKLQNTQVKYQRAEALHAIAESGTNEGQQLDQYFVQPNKEIDIVKSLEQLAVNLSLNSTTEVIESQDLAILQTQNKDLLHLTMNVTGRLSSVRKFQSTIESLPYNVRLNKVDLYFVSSANASSSVSVWRGRYDISLVKKKASQ